MRVEVSCTECGHHKRISPSRLLNRRKPGAPKYHFCSKRCLTSWRKGQAGTQHPLSRHVTVRCSECGAAKAVSPSPVSRRGTVSRHFCNQTCRGAFLSQAMKGAGHHMYRGRPVQIVCLWCGREKLKFRSQSEGNRFCSSICCARWHGWRRRKTRTPQQKLAVVFSNRIRAGIYASIRKNKAGRSWETLVGYTVAQLKRRLQRTMPTGYTWADLLAGHLHIDHEVPLSVFRFTTAEDIDFKRAWALRNLQLLPADVNIRNSEDHQAVSTQSVVRQYDHETRAYR